MLKLKLIYIEDYQNFYFIHRYEWATYIDYILTIYRNGERLPQQHFFIIKEAKTPMVIGMPKVDASAIEYQKFLLSGEGFPIENYLDMMVYAAGLYHELWEKIVFGF